MIEPHHLELEQRRSAEIMLRVYCRGQIAHDRNFSDCILFGPATHTKIEEVGSANFSELHGIINLSHQNLHRFCQALRNTPLLYLASERFGLEAIEGDVRFG